MEPRSPGNPTRRLRCLALLLCVSLLPVGGLGAHASHGADGSETPVFGDARHAGLAEHCEAAETIRPRRCPACLAPARADALTPARTAGEPRLEPRPESAGGAAHPPRPAAVRSSRPRAPPVS